MVLNRASLADAPAIKSLMDTAKEEILNVPLAEIKKAIVRGECIWQDGICIIYERKGNAKYYGVTVGSRGVHILQLIAAAKGDGSARRVMEAFISEVAAPVYLLVKSANLRGRAFYKKLGFWDFKEVKFPTFSSQLMVRQWPLPPSIAGASAAPASSPTRSGTPT